ncbi:MAG TPA: sensor histidine kinase [Cellulomonas sp.]|uniref:sensor histidine kinase n=1 Tax=Cellulomonas sp. TaxID=40001 RepID=UPI002E34B94C|nr:sensor histidine kinase [Cellulomonas sp.]HEX5331373.1 sensor histidine kinase [Cellulomonas sp.]
MLDLQLEPWEFEGDPAAMERAVLNVLDNAIKFSPPGSAVRIELDRGVLTVSDSGPGIPTDEQELVFDRFWRSPDARAMPGSGLGLAIVADVVSAHGGSVSAATAPTGGAVITLRIPGRVPATSTA